MMICSTATVLPLDFTPNPDLHWIIGRGRVVKAHNGKFDEMIETVARDYSAAPCKAEKGTILTELLNKIHEAGPDAGFVRRDPSTGRYVLVEESLARQTAAQAIRNVLSGCYRSSKQFKQKRRIQKLRQEAEINTSGPLTTDAPPRCVSVESLPENGSCTVAENDKDTLSILLLAFATNIDPLDNSFEPRPIAPSVEARMYNVFHFDPIVFEV